MKNNVTMLSNFRKILKKFNYKLIKNFQIKCIDEKNSTN